MIWNWSELTSEKAVPCHGNGGPSFLVGAPGGLAPPDAPGRSCPKEPWCTGRPGHWNSPCLEGSKTVNIWYTPRVEHGSPENEDGFQVWNLRSPMRCTFFRWSIGKTSRGSFLYILRDFPFFLQLMVQKSPVDMVNIPLFIGFHKTFSWCSWWISEPSNRFTHRTRGGGLEVIAKSLGLGTRNSTSATWCSGVVNRNPSFF